MAYQEKREEGEGVQPKSPKVEKFSMAVVWQIAVVILVVALAASILTKGFTFTGAATGSVLTPQQAADKALAFINDMLDGQAVATISSVNESNGLYSLKLSIESQEYNSYITKDGSLLFPSAYNLSGFSPSASGGSGSGSSSSSSSGPTYPKSERPEVELFVMSFCPYGVQAENAMKPVADLLGDYADFKIKFIVNVAGTTPESVQSLHGAPEAMEDLRQVCVRENYAQDVMWKYVAEINKNCYSIYRNATAMDACWRAAAAEAGVNATLVENCVNSTAVSMISQDETDAHDYGVTGSPTLIINGKRYSGARSSEAFKAAICSAFNEPPEECGQTLSSSESAASGGCGG